MSWGDETPEHADEMQQQALPRADVLDSERLELLSEGFAPPQAAAAGEAAGTAAAAASAGAPTWSRTLAPRHRRAVESYFGAAKPAPPAGATPAAGGR
jgi:CelD/BcsL family acetyltransferase involved in cellulose biosynthesis